MAAREDRAVKREGRAISRETRMNKSARGVTIIAVALVIAGLALFARLEQASCQRSNNTRVPFQRQAEVFSKISAEYTREAGETTRYSAAQRVDFTTRAANLKKDAEAQQIKKLDCSLPLPER